MWAIQGGLRAWQEAGYPLATGSDQNSSSSQSSTDQLSYTEISVTELQEMTEEKDFLLINVHIPHEGNIPQTDLEIPFDDIPAYLDLLPEDKETPIVLYCKGSSMSRSAAEELISLGYSNIFNLEGGYTAWTEAGFPLESE